MIKNILLYLRIGVWIGAPIFFLALPKTYFDSGESISLFGRLGIEGHYSAGLTRACIRIVHFDFAGAWEYNKLSFIVFPLLVGVWFFALRKDLIKLKKLHNPAAENG